MVEPSKRIAFDSNVVDRVDATPGLLELIQAAAEAGRLVMISTHVQEDELAAIPDAGRRDKLLEVYHALPTVLVATHGLVLGVSRLGLARLGDGGWTGVAIDDLDSPNWKHRSDALIGVTAAGEADVLVTCERRLAARMQKAGAPCEVWDFEQFRQFVEVL